MQQPVTESSQCIAARVMYYTKVPPCYYFPVKIALVRSGSECNLKDSSTFFFLKR